jgi:hypothetical protein
MEKKTSFTAFLFGMLTLLTACGPSRAELDQTATAQALNEFATQTAEAPTQTPQPTRTPLPSPTSTTAPVDILFGSTQALEQIGTYHVEMEIQMTFKQEGLSMEVPLTYTGDIGSEDSMVALVTMTIMGITVETEMIQLEGTTYMTNPETGQWEVTETQVTPVDPTDFTDIDLTDIENLSHAGKEILDGIEVYHLTGTLPAEKIGETGDELHIEYWIGVEDLLTRKVAFEGEIDFLDNGIMDEDVPSRMGMTMTMALSDFGKDVVIEAPEISPAQILVDSPFGQMAVYESSLYPFSIQYPSHWDEHPPSTGITAQFGIDQGGVLTLAEEDLIAMGFGELSLEQYGDIVSNNIKSFAPDAVFLSRTPFTTQDDLSGEVIALTLQGGFYEARRFYYLSDEYVAFNATYLAPKARFAELEPMITYSFGTFRVTGSDCLGSFPATKTIPAIPPMGLNQNPPPIERLEIALWPEFDTEDVLVIYRIHLLTDTELPVRVTLPIPSHVGQPSAVAWRGEDGQLFNANYERLIQGNWALIEIEAESNYLQLEYYASLMQEDSWKGYEFIWPGGLPLSSFRYEIMLPEGISDWDIFPPFESQVTNTEGFTFYQVELGPQMTSSTFSIRLCYCK